MKFEESAGGIVYRKSMTSDSQPIIEWLICQHSYHKGWGFPKGLIGDTKENESKEETAVREVDEEGGIKAKIVVSIPKPVEYFYKHEGELIKKRVYYFLMEYISGSPDDHDWEMMDAKFVTTDEVKKILTFKSDKQAFDQALELFVRKI